MKIVVIDGQGGGMGRSIVQLLRRELPEAHLVAVGTNAVATSAMLKAGAPVGATGENAVAVACRKADIIVGPVGIVIADSLFGEITPAMAAAVGQSGAKRVLIPFNHCDNILVGVSELSVGALLQEAVEVVRQLAGSPG